MDGTMRNSALVPNAASTGNSLPPPIAYLAMNAKSEDLNWIAGAQHNIAYHYSTEWETQLVQDLSAEKEIIKRLQTSANAKRALLMTGCGNPSTSAPNQYLSVQQQANLNPYVQPFAPTSVPIVPQPWLMQGYAVSLPTSLYGVQYGLPIGSNGAQVGQSNATVPTSAMQIPCPTSLSQGDNSNNSGREFGGAGSSQITPDPDLDGVPEKKKRNKTIDAKRKIQFLIDSESLKAANGRLRGTMKCKVERYERGTDLTIVD